MPFSLVSLTQTKTESTPLLTKPPALSPPLKGYLYHLISAAIYSFVSLLIHLALTKYDFSILSSAIVRAAIPAILSVLTLSQLRPPALSASRLRMLAARGLIGAVSLFCNYEALRRIPVATLETICATCPAITSLFCAIFLGEKITYLEVGALVASLVGVVLVAQSSPKAENLHGPPWIGALLAFGSAVFTSAACTFVRALGTRVHAVHNVLALSLGVAVGCVLFSRGPDYEAVLLNKPGMVFTTIAVLLGFVGASLFNAGLQLCRAGPGLLIRTMKIPLTYLLGLWLLGEQCGTGAIVGAVLIVGSAIAVWVYSSAGGEIEDIPENSEDVLVEGLEELDTKERSMLDQSKV